jgi:glutamate-ammonia-ligase adenylyltransferase
VVAGDQHVGSQFLSELDSFIWRINLDYRSLDEIGDLKQKINLEHPALRLARDQDHDITTDCTDFNIKLGRGGIREIEFIVNAMQLIWGGRRIALRISNTLDALTQLSTEKLLDVAVAQQLKFAYCLFRRVENAVQMLDNQQQYQLPSTEERQQALLQLLNRNSWQQLTEEIYQQRVIVAHEFNACFTENEAQQPTGSFSSGLLEDDLQPAAKKIINGWLNGFQIYGVANSETHQLKELFDYLIEELHDSCLPASDAIMRIDGFFRSMPTGIQYFRLLQAHPVLLKSIIRPLLISPPMATLLEQSPHIVDALITPMQQDHQFNPQSRSDFVLASMQAEVRAERLRRFVNEELYTSYLGLLRGQISTVELHQRLTRIAQHTLDLGLTINCNQMQLNEPPIAVLGLGKLGMHSMSPLSDLDLIFIAESVDDIESANRFARRFQHLMETRMKEGIAYEMDMRLRPSGRSGPPTVSLDSFEKYHLQRAQTWEHIALIPGRFVTGNQVIGAQASTIRQRLLVQPRDYQQFINDAWKMLSRIRDQRIAEVTADSLSVKLRRGGLMEADYLSACIAIVQIPQQPDWAALDYSQLLEAISNNTRYTELSAIVQFWRHLQVWVRLLNLETSQVSDFPAQELSFFLAELGLSSGKQLSEKVRNSARIIDDYISQFMQDRSLDSTKQTDDWEETTVIWLNDRG